RSSQTGRMINGGLKRPVTLKKPVGMVSFLILLLITGFLSKLPVCSKISKRMGGCLPYPGHSTLSLQDPKADRRHTPLCCLTAQGI
ncbi:hypothetical protein, partial [Komagataeibacter europaeus]|uniref:hypothetical protein n=1 Tax=Komagataeibacter europaeus TaxID=33995 RepID=UPI00223275E6